MIAVRRARIQDASAIGSFICPLADKFIASDFSPSGRDALLGSLSQSAIEGYLQQVHRYHLAEMNGQLIGLVGVRDNTHLFHLFVAEEFHRQGVGKMLWATAKSECIASGHDGPWTVNASRFSVAFYEKLGFVCAGPSETRNDVTYFPMVTG